LFLLEEKMNPVHNMDSVHDSALPLRSRSAWEAVDSGVLLWRSNFAFFIPFFAVPVWVTACCLRLFSGELFFIPYLGLWWLKPLFDRVVLHIVSKRFFGSSAPSRLNVQFNDQFNDLCHGISETRRGLLGDLLWRRFSPGRAARMPVRVLERLGAKQFAARKKVLEGGGINFCSFISVLGLALEAALLLGEILFALMTASLFFPTAVEYLRENNQIAEIFIFAAFCFNYILVESLYVCMGFGLYINSRVEVEGWDLELLFKKFAKLQIAVRQSVAAVTKIALFVCLFSVLAFPAYSQIASDFPDDFPVPDERAVLDLREILASPDFGSEREGWTIRFKDSDYEELPDLDLEAGLEKIRALFGFLLRFFVVLVVLTFAVFVFYWLIKNRRKIIQGELFAKKPFRLAKNRQSERPEKSAESLFSIFSMAEDFFRKGNSREAWAACFSACLGAYALTCSVTFPADATEYDCLALVREAVDYREQDFGEIVQNWILFAYADRPPAQGAFEKALAHGRSLLEGK
jgi:hypothetical protein